MKISFEISQAERHTAVQASRHDYDSPVLAPVEFFAAPLQVNHDRLHVAAALIFHREISGQIELDENATCSRHVAVQIGRFFNPVDVSVRNQIFTARAIPEGSYVSPLHITVDNHPCPLVHDIGRGEMLIRFVPEAVGAMYSEFELAIGTNLRQGHQSLDSSADDIVRLIGAAVIFTEEFQVSGFRLPGGWHDDKSLDRLTRVSALLSTVGLSLEWD